jgi:hypothetical protein
VPLRPRGQPQDARDDIHAPHQLEPTLDDAALDDRLANPLQYVHMSSCPHPTMTLGAGGTASHTLPAVGGVDRLSQRPVDLVAGSRRAAALSTYGSTPPIPSLGDPA